MMEDGLYLNDVWVCDAEDIALTLQGNDLQKPSTIQSSYSNAITLPDSTAVRTLTENAEGPDSLSRWPYKRIPAYVVSAGNVTFRGTATLEQFSNGWEVSLSDEKINVFDGLGRSIRTASLDRYNFKWNIQTINAAQYAQQGVVFPLIDYGTISGGEVPADAIYPALYVHTLLDQMLKEEGFSISGEIRNDPFYKSLALPFVEQDPVNRSDEWVDDRRARVTVPVVPPVLMFGGKIDRVQELTVVDKPLETWTQGKAGNYKVSIKSYVPDEDMRVLVDAVQTVSLSIDFGGVEAYLIVEKNGVEVASERLARSGPYNQSGVRQDIIQLSATVNCKAGDQLRIRFRMAKQTVVAQWKAVVFNDPDKVWVNYAPDNKVQYGDTWPVARNLPDITGVELVKAVAFLMCGTWDAKAIRRLLVFNGLTDAVNSTAIAADWSTKIDERGATYKPRVDGYGIINRLKWKETDGVTKGFGDGIINCNAETLPPDVTLFDLPFAATENAVSSIAGYGEPLKIETRTVTKDTSGNITISKKNTMPRLILVDNTKSFDVPTKVLTETGAILPVNVSLMPAWFSKRPAISVRAETAFCLCFDLVTGQFGEQSLIKRYYGGLIRILRRPRTLEVYLLLRPSDVMNIDLNRPIRLHRIRAGNMYLNDGYYYLNKIENYFPDLPCKVTLIAF